MSNWDADQAQWYAESWGVHPTHDIALALAELTADDVVVDIGCGNGHFARLAAKVCGQVIGVDPTEEMRHLAAEETTENTDRIVFVDGRAGSLPVADGAATVVTAIHSWHHWEDTLGGLAEVRRVLAPGGRLLLVEEDLDGTFGHMAGDLADPDVVLQLLTDEGFEAAERFDREHDGAAAIVLRAVRGP